MDGGNGAFGDVVVRTVGGNGSKLLQMSGGLQQRYDAHLKGTIKQRES